MIDKCYKYSRSLCTHSTRGSHFVTHINSMKGSSHILEVLTIIKVVRLLEGEQIYIPMESQIIALKCFKVA